MCLICGKPVEPFISFGRMPIANGFLTRQEFEHEFFFELKVGYCQNCGMVQLTELIDPSKLFHENYAYFSSISQRMKVHFREFAELVIQRHLSQDNPFVVEIGSNDGIMLRHFADAGIRHLGVEPSANVAEVAMANGINTVCRFFSEQAGKDICQDYGSADVVLGANVVCHLPDMHTIIKGIKSLLREDGLFIFEEPYLGDIVEKASYDQIYDEHVFYFSLHSLRNLFGMYDMEIVDVEPQNVHGGSMRYFVARKGVKQISPSVSQHLKNEERLGLLDPATYEKLRQRIFESRDRLVKLLMDLKQQDKRVVGYGATSKSTTVTNFCAIGPELIEFISDTTPGKQGKYSPGVHIPVLPYTAFQERYPDFALLFAWNHGEEIIEKEKAFQDQGGRFIVYVPSVNVIEGE